METRFEFGSKVAPKEKDAVVRTRGSMNLIRTHPNWRIPISRLSEGGWRYFNRVTLAGACLAACLGIACGDPPVSLSSVSGSYKATRFETVRGSETNDILEMGGRIDLVLQSNASFTSHIIVPEAESGSPLDVSFAGTWSLEGSVVRLFTDTDIFLRDIGLIFSSGALAGEGQFGDVVVKVTLSP